MKNISNVNNEYFDSKKSFKLRKIAVSLAIVGSLALVGCGSKDDFKYDSEKSSSYAVQYETETNYNLNSDEEEIASIMENYEIAKSNYQDNKSDESKAALISSSNKLETAALTLMKGKVSEVINEDPSEFTITKPDNDALLNRGPDYNKTHQELPKEFSTLVREQNNLKIHNNNEDINKIISTGDIVISEMNDMLNNSYSFEDDKIVNTSEQK